MEKFLTNWKPKPSSSQPSKKPTKKPTRKTTKKSTPKSKNNDANSHIKVIPSPIQQQEVIPHTILQQEVISHTILQQEVIPPPILLQEVFPPPILQQQLNPPPILQQEVIPPLILQQQVIPPPILQQVLPPPILQQEVNSPPILQQEVISPPILQQEVLSPPILQQEVNEDQTCSKRSRGNDKENDLILQPSLKKSISRQINDNVDLSCLVVDPGLRQQISEFHPNQQNAVRRLYLHNGPCQPGKVPIEGKPYPFPKRLIGKSMRQFNGGWYTNNGSWLEYSVSKDALFCFYCFLFGKAKGKQGGGDTFVECGFRNWEKMSRLQEHIGLTGSAHNKAYAKAQDFLKPSQHVGSFFSKKSEESRMWYRLRLNTIVDCIKFLLRQGLAFRGHDESETSTNRGNFLELLDYTANHNIDIKLNLQSGPDNLKLTSNDIQKDIASACAVETTKAILNELGDAFFSILVDEARDISIKEQMAIVLRFVDNRGCVIERFLCVVHVKDTSAISLKSVIDSIFSIHGLTYARMRGQGYDGASNMRGSFNGLQALVMRENESAYYVHCFAHQLQLVLVAVVTKHDDIALLFNTISTIVNTVGASCKRRDSLREKHASQISNDLKVGEILSGKGMNQEIGVKRAGDTRWSSHYGSLLNLIRLYPSILEVLSDILEDGSSPDQRDEASRLVDTMLHFRFIFGMLMMKNILGICNDLCKALQRDNQDIVNAMDLVNVCKKRLQEMRENGWESLLADVSSLCDKYKVAIPKMEDMYVAPRKCYRLAKKANNTSNLHYYKFDMLVRCIDLLKEELGQRFNEGNTELLLCMSCLDPSDSFAAFDKGKLIRFAQLYRDDFSEMDLLVLHDQLENYIYDVRTNEKFTRVQGISGLAREMVLTKKNVVYPLVYLLMKLALTLPVATASVERAFSSMRIVKTRLRNRMGDEWLNDCLVTYIEKDTFDSIGNEAIMQRFQCMAPRRGKL